MAICLINKSGGGITSDDVTASKAQVLQGYRTITSDSDDEVIEGTIVNRGNIVDTTGFENAYWDSKYLARMEQGFYSQNEQWKPCVAIPYEVLAQTIGVDRSKMLDTLTIAGKQGQIKSINTQDNNYRINKSTTFGIDNLSDSTNPVFYVDLQNGNAFYNRPDGHPHVCIDAASLGTAGADAVLQGQTATSVNGVRFEGTVPRWVCNTGDVISANNDMGFAWDDIYAGRGRGIIVGIKNGHYIQGAGWVFLPSPNLQPWNIREGVNINNVIGTMKDYSTGRVVFNGATFDGTILLGVANKDFYVGRDYYSLKIDDRYGYTGIYGGGINLNLSTTMPSIRGRYIGCIMSQSVNLAPFNRIDVYWRVVGDVKNDAYIDFVAGIAKASALRRGGMFIASSPKDGFNEESVKRIAKSSQITKSGKIELYVGGINEHAFLYFCASVNINNYNRDAFTGAVQIVRIDFLN